jgi:hypothetical protein
MRARWQEAKFVFCSSCFSTSDISAFAFHSFVELDVTKRGETFVTVKFSASTGDYFVICLGSLLLGLNTVRGLNWFANAAKALVLGM